MVSTLGLHRFGSIFVASSAGRFEIPPDNSAGYEDSEARGASVVALRQRGATKRGEALAHQPGAEGESR